jgi:hypothetical protein
MADLTLAQLQQLARDNGLIGYAGSTKSQLLDQLMDAGILPYIARPASPRYVSPRPASPRYVSPPSSASPPRSPYLSPRSPISPRPVSPWRTGPFSNFTIKELHQLARLNNLKGYITKTKPELINMLIQAGADPNARPIMTYTPYIPTADTQAQIDYLNIYNLPQPASTFRIPSPRSPVLTRPVSPRYAGQYPYTLTDLRQMFRDAGIKGYSTKNRDQLIDMAIQHGLIKPQNKL